MFFNRNDTNQNDSFLDESNILKCAQIRPSKFDLFNCKRPHLNEQLFVHLLQLYHLSCKVTERHHLQVYTLSYRKYRDFAYQLCFLDDVKKGKLLKRIRVLEQKASQQASAYKRTLKLSIHSTCNLSAALPATSNVSDQSNTSGRSKPSAITRLMLNVQILTSGSSSLSSCLSNYSSCASGTSGPPAYKCLKQSTLQLHRYQKKSDDPKVTGPQAIPQITQSVWMPCRNWLTGHYESISLTLTSEQVNKDPFVVVQLLSCTEESIDQYTLRSIGRSVKCIKQCAQQAVQKCWKCFPSVQNEQGNASKCKLNDLSGDALNAAPPTPNSINDNALIRTIGWMRFRLSSLRPGVNRLHMQLLATNGQPLQINLHVYTLLKCHWWQGGYVHFRRNWMLHGFLIEQLIRMRLKAKDAGSDWLISSTFSDEEHDSDTGSHLDSSAAQSQPMDCTLQIRASTDAGRKAMRKLKKKKRRLKLKRNKIQDKLSNLNFDPMLNQIKCESETNALEQCTDAQRQNSIGESMVRQQKYQKRMKQQRRWKRMAKWKRMRSKLNYKASLVRRSWIIEMAPHVKYLANLEEDSGKRVCTAPFKDWNGLCNSSLFEFPVYLTKQAKVHLTMKGVSASNFCICSEWCNVHSFYYHNSVGRFAVAQNHRLFAVPAHFVIPLHLMSLARLMREKKGQLRCYNLLSSLLSELSRNLTRLAATHHHSLRNLWMSQQVDMLLGVFSHLWHLRNSLHQLHTSSSGNEEEEAEQKTGRDIEYLSQVLQWLQQLLQLIFNLRQLPPLRVKLDF